MPDYFVAEIHFEVPFEMGPIDRLAIGFKQALADNWIRLGETAKASLPEVSDFEHWLAVISSGTLERVPEEIVDEEEIEFWSESYSFLFSPYSFRVADMCLYQYRDGTLGFGLSVCSYVKYMDTSAPPTLRDAEDIWTVNKACLRHLLETLAALLPVRSTQIDLELGSIP